MPLPGGFMLQMRPRVFAVVTATSILYLTGLPDAQATAPTAQDVDVYTSLCRIGSEATGTLTAEIGAVSRRILAGQLKLAASDLQDSFPGIKNEQNRLLALQSFQDCMYRYVDRFHLAASAAKSDGATTAASSVVLDPAVPPERRREIVYLASELESFKGKMAAVARSLPETYYDKRDSSQKRPRDDARMFGLADYRRYKPFEASGGGLNFAEATNNDLALLCSAYGDEVQQYQSFAMAYYPLSLPQYNVTGETLRLCEAARRGR